MKRNKIKWDDITKKYLGSPYKLGSWDPKEGMDCLSLVGSIALDVGYPVNFEDNFGGLTIDNYKNHDEKKLNLILVDYIRNRLEETPLKEAQNGDLVILINPQTNEEFVGVLCGNAKFMTCSIERGIVIFPLKNTEVIEVRKCRKD